MRFYVAPPAKLAIKNAEMDVGHKLNYDKFVFSPLLLPASFFTSNMCSFPNLICYYHPNVIINYENEAL